MCSDQTGNQDVIMGYSVAGMYIVVMVHGRWIRVVWATSWRCEFPVADLAGDTED